LIRPENPFAKKQLGQAKGPQPMMTCSCGAQMPLRFAYKCLYCDEYFCKDCMEQHLGQTVKKYWDSKKFEIDHCYEHTSGTQMKIVGVVETTVYGKCLVGEELSGTLKPISPTGTDNWREITEEEWMKNFSDGGDHDA
jgi:hypothetical protein